MAPVHREVAARLVGTAGVGGEGYGLVSQLLLNNDGRLSCRNGASAVINA